ncbi:aspergillopepsin A precursor, partial [Sporormia fimetaria CBS 119925]
VPIANGPREILKTYRKYHVEPPEHLVKAAELRSAQIAGMMAGGQGYDDSPKNENGTVYITPMRIGGVPLNLIVDTGSPDLWTYSDLQLPENRENHSYYNTSNGQLLEDYYFRTYYADYSGAYGPVYLDTVTIGPLSVPQQAIGAAEDVWYFDDTRADGILGLSFSEFSSIRPYPLNNFFDNLRPYLSAPVFAVSLTMNDVGSYDFGFIDHEKYASDLVWTDVNNTFGYWAFAASGFALRNYTFPDYHMDIITDTGTTLTYLDPMIVRLYYDLVPRARYSLVDGAWVFPCGSRLPDLTLLLENGEKLVAFGYQFNWEPLNPATPNICYGGLQSSEWPGFNILGATFLDSKYVVHEYREEASRLGFADR